MTDLHPYEHALYEAANRDNRLIICTAETRYAMRNLENLLGERFIDVGISEQTLIGMAAGLAKMGNIPICHALANFLLMRPFEFIRTDLDYPNLSVVLVGSFAGFFSQGNGPTHQAVDDISLMSHLPNMKIVAPANLGEMVWVIENIADNINSPIYLRFNDYTDNNLTSCNLQKIPQHWSKNYLPIKGKDTLVISYGLCFSLLLIASDQLPANTGLLNLIFLWPLDPQFFRQLFREYKTIIVVEDHRYVGGLCYHTKALAYDMQYRGRVVGLNLGDQFFQPLLLNDLLEYEGFSSSALIEKIHSVLN